MRFRAKPAEIVVLTDDRNNKVDERLLEGILAYNLKANAFSMSISTMRDQPSLDGLRHAEGMITMIGDESFLQGLRELAIPVINLKEGFEGSAEYSLVYDHRALGKAGAEELIRLGMTRFAFLSAELDHGVTWSRRRMEGFSDRIARQGFSCDVKTLSKSGPDRLSIFSEVTSRSVESWLENLEKPLGVMALSDGFAFLVLESCQNLGYRVPQDVSIIGCGNSWPDCHMRAPHLSSVDLDYKSWGEGAAAMLDEVLSGSGVSPVVRYYSKASIVSRTSTDIQAVDDPIVSRACRFIQENACRGIDVSDVLKHANASRSQLDGRFKRKLGHSPKTAIQIRKLTRVKELLIDSDLTLEAIAEKSGFSYVGNMSNAFKELTGLRPGAYRRSFAGASTGRPK